MFKKYYNAKENAIIYVGRTVDIRAMYRSMASASRKYHTDLIPLFSGIPLFSEVKMTYGLVIDGDFGFFCIIDSDTFTAMLLAGELVEVKEDED